MFAARRRRCPSASAARRWARGFAVGGNYWQWVQQTWSKAFSKARPPATEHVCVDVSSLLYRAASQKGDLVKNAVYKLDALFAMIRVPTQSILIAFDGPAGAAKLTTQRKRRLPPTSATSLHLLSGSSTLPDVEKAVRAWVCRRMERSPRFRRLDVFVSGPDVPGEGEIKCFGRLLKLQAQAVRHRKRPPRCVIVGGDGDLAVLALAIGAPPGLAIYADDKRHFLHMRGVRSRLRGPSQERTALDIALMSLFQGNDYLPRLRCTNIKRIHHVYERARTLFPDQYLLTRGSGQSDSPTFNWAFLRLLSLGKTERQDMDSEPPREWVWNADGGSGGCWTQQDVDAEVCVRRYLECLLWNLDMYRTGSCLDYDVAYPAYTRGPTIDELIEHGPAAMREVSAPRRRNTPPLPHASFMSIVPREATKIKPSPIPPHLVPLLAPESAPRVRDWYGWRFRAEPTTTNQQRVAFDAVAYRSLLAAVEEEEAKRGVEAQIAFGTPVGFLSVRGRMKKVPPGTVTEFDEARSVSHGLGRYTVSAAKLHDFVGLAPKWPWSRLSAPPLREVELDAHATAYLLIQDVVSDPNPLMELGQAATLLTWAVTWETTVLADGSFISELSVDGKKVGKGQNEVYKKAKRQAAASYLADLRRYRRNYVDL